VVLRTDEQGFQLRSGLHTTSDAFCDQAGREELILDVERLLRRIDRLEEESLHLPHLLIGTHCRLCASDADADIMEIWTHVRRPRIGAGLNALQLFARDALPTVAYHRR